MKDYLWKEYMFVRPSAGADITTTILNSIVMSIEIDAPVKFNFNEIEIIIDAKSISSELANSLYYTKLRKGE